MNDMNSAHVINYQEWFDPSNYHDLYNLPANDFFKQVAIRDKWLGELSANSSLRLSTIKQLIKGEVILPLDFKLDLYSYVRPLSFESAITIASIALGMVDQKKLTLDPPNVDAELAKSAPLFLKMVSNIGNKEFEGKSFDEAVYGRKCISTTTTLEIDLEINTKELVEQFRTYVEAEKHAIEKLNNQGKYTKKIDDFIGKLKAYKVIEAYDLLKISKKLDFTITQKELALFLFEDWTDDNLRKKTIKHIDMIFEWEFYNNILTGKK